MNRNKLHIEELQAEFGQKPSFHIDELKNFYRNFEPSLKRSTVEWRIYELQRRRILERVGRGRYRVGQSSAFVPEPDQGLKEVYKSLIEAFPFIEHACLWRSEWLTPFLIHQPTRKYRYMEVHRDALEAVFDHLKQNEGVKVYIDPSPILLDRYSEGQEEFILTPLISEAPVQYVKGLPVPTIEKLVVDFFIEKERLAIGSSKDFQHFFQSALSEYRVDRNKLLRYARRRGQEDRISDWLFHVTKKRH